MLDQSVIWWRCGPLDTRPAPWGPRCGSGGCPSCAPWGPRRGSDVLLVRLGGHDAGVLSFLGTPTVVVCQALLSKRPCGSRELARCFPKGAHPNDVSHETELSWMFTMFSGLRPHQRAIRDFAPRDHAGAKEAAGAEVPARVRLPEPKSQRLQAVTLLAKSRTHRSILAWLPKPLQQHDGLRCNGSLLC